MISKKKRLLFLTTALVIGAALVYWSTRGPTGPSRTLTVYGNVDIRQVELAFNDSGRVKSLRVQEGDRVTRGQPLAELDSARYRDAVDRDRATVDAQAQVLARLLAGTRPEEIAEARAAVTAARATLENAEILWKRQKALAAEHDITRQRLDDVTAALKTARADFDRRREALALALKGPRKEDIEVARARLQADRAALALALRKLRDTRLRALEDGVVEDRIVEPGDMVSPGTPVFSLALDNPVWVRAYLPETALGRVRLGMRAWIESDSFPGKRFAGWVGFISPTAEFTPKTVETPALRTELVYRVRVYACNPRHELRLGMPVTVRIPLKNNRPRSLAEHPCGR